MQGRLALHAFLLKCCHFSRRSLLKDGLALHDEAHHATMQQHECLKICNSTFRLGFATCSKPFMASLRSELGNHNLLVLH
jgi:hypothetical protein